MSSAQGYSPPPTLAGEHEEEYVESQPIRHEDRVEQRQERPAKLEVEPRPDPELQQEPKHQQEPEPVASSSHSQVPDQPPEAPPKDRDSEGRLSVLNPPRFSQVIDWNTTVQPSFATAAQLMSQNANRPNDNANTNSAGSTLNGSNRNTGTGGRNMTTTNVNPGIIRPIPVTNSGTPLNPNLSQVHLPPSRPLSSLERRPTGPGLVSYNPIRGDSTIQGLYLSDSNGYDGGGDPADVPNRNAGRRGMVPGQRPRSAVSPADGTMVGNGLGAWSGSRRASRLMSGQDWLVGVPVVEQPPKQKTLEERLKPTIDAATAERDKYKKRSSQQGLIINGAIGLQVIVGALTTGVAASGTLHIGTVVSVLGGLSTILASYLAKVRGSGEPEYSTIRTRELNSYLREVGTFVLDHGDKTGTEHEDQITAFRERFEAIIKTDGEDSGGGPGCSHHTPSTQPPSQRAAPPPARPASGDREAMPGAYDPHGSDEKQYLCKSCKKEKAIDAVA